MRTCSLATWCFVVASGCVAREKDGEHTFAWSPLGPVAEYSSLVWIEDGRGPRQAQWSGREPDRYEVALQATLPDGIVREWGTLVLASTDPWLGRWSDPVDRTAELATLLDVVRDLAEAVREPSDDLRSAMGPVVILGKPEREPPELRDRIDTLAHAVCRCVAMGTFAHLASHELPRDAARDARMVAVGQETIAAIRFAARRLGEMTSAAARRNVPNQDGDGAALAALRTAMEHARAALSDWNALVPVATCFGTSRDLAFRFWTDAWSAKPVVVGRTHVSFGEDEVTIVQFEIPSGELIEIRDGELRVITTTVPRALLRDARIVESEGREGSSGVFRSDCSIEISTPKVAPVRLISPFGILPGAMSELVIHCDTPMHRAQLIADLQRFAAAGAR